MIVYRCSAATTEIEKLATKYRSVWDNVSEFERLLATEITERHVRYPGLGLTRGPEPAAIWKARIICPELGGKSSGLRYIYERGEVAGEQIAVCLTVYVHQQSKKHEKDVVRIIRERFRQYDLTPDDIKQLERADLD